MKLGDRGESFFVFEAMGFVPEEMQTSSLVSPSASPKQLPTISDPASLQVLEYLNIADGGRRQDRKTLRWVTALQSVVRGEYSLIMYLPQNNQTTPESHMRPSSGDLSTYNLKRSASEISLTSARRYTMSGQRQTRDRGDVMLDMNGYKIKTRIHFKPRYCEKDSSRGD
ncbi:hypothetical protein L211DRAFT_324195 [Terfezia boudieri ATCC MYA-4762]|uniref:Uncharacterized protein n=1 Tax=Terfezia boudieri ATCC MYA-4762 TaxID=1051890 RepID=A0A3N4LIP0_9PEZI|nr:hypothetical protein L211DRAFT_324195 [Terfezia boudieri ATCC MYA-4762]